MVQTLHLIYQSTIDTSGYNSDNFDTLGVHISDVPLTHGVPVPLTFTLLGGTANIRREDSMKLSIIQEMNVAQLQVVNDLHSQIESK